MDYNFSGKTILIVEDEYVSRYYFGKALKKTNANIFFANDGIEAVEIMGKSPGIDLILMDIRLPRMDGIEATSKIKGLFPKIPVIVQTAYAMQSIQDEAIKSGCDEFITKPVRISILLSILQKYLIQ